MSLLSFVDDPVPVIELARYQEGPADVVDILRAGGAEATDRHRDLATNAGASQVEAALRR